MNSEIAIHQISVNDPEVQDEYFLFIGHRRHSLLEIMTALDQEELQVLQKHVQVALEHRTEQEQNA